MATITKRSLARTIRSANKRLLVEFQLDRLPDFFAPEYVVHTTEEAVLAGHQLVIRYLEMIRRAFPELQVEVEILIEKNDRIAWQRTCRGIQKGPLQGFPPCGREIVWRDMVVSRFCDGLIAEDWVISDLAEQLLRARKKQIKSAP